MMSISDFNSAKRCDKHDMSGCLDCRDAQKIVRTHDGELHYEGDCGVSTFREITECDYETALAAMRFGEDATLRFVPGKGTPEGRIVNAIEDAGYKVEQCFLDEWAMSRQSFFEPCAFVVVGWAGRDGHAWTITNGLINRHFLNGRRYRYRAYRITTR